MAQIGTLAMQKVLAVLRGQQGVPAAAAAVAAQQGLTMPGVPAEQIVGQNVAPEVMERSAGSKYPLLCAYCAKFTNVLREKFRIFSGDAELVVEIRVSQDRLEDLEQRLQAYVDAVTGVLDASRGDWGDGMFFAGGYEVSFGAVKHGGSNFLQVAKVMFRLDVSAG